MVGYTAWPRCSHISGSFARTSASANGGGTSYPQWFNEKEKTRRSGFDFYCFVLTGNDQHL
jgi:hypothetical protein